MTDLICRARIYGGRNVVFESATAKSTILEQQIEDDKKYGFMEPKNGMLTYAILNGDEELTEEQIEKICYRATYRWSVYAKIDFVKVRPDMNPDFTFRFNDKEHDDNLDDNTLAYMGYPFKGNKFYGICVINKKFLYTIDGDPISGYQMEALGFPVQFPNGQYKTYDLDIILYHEVGHGIFGLPHSQTGGNGMSPRYGSMAEIPSDEDVARATSPHKAKKRGWPERFTKMVLTWLRAWTDSS